MSESGAPLRACAECGAVASAGAATCWLCGGALPEDGGPGPLKRASPGGGVAARARGREREGQGFSYSLSTLLLVMTLAAVCCGLLAVAPGLGIPACIVLAPVLVRTSMVVRRREAAGLSVSGPEKIGLVVGSFLTTAIIIAVVTVAAVGTFCGICLGIYSVAGEQSAGAASVVAFLVAGVVTLAVVFAFVRLVQARFRRDVGAPLPDGAAAPKRPWYWIFPTRGANFFAVMVLVGIITGFVQASMSGPYFQPLPLEVGAIVEIGILALYLFGRKPRGGQQ